MEATKLSLKEKIQNRLGIIDNSTHVIIAFVEECDQKNLRIEAFFAITLFVVTNGIEALYATPSLVTLLKKLVGYRMPPLSILKYSDIENDMQAIEALEESSFSALFKQGMRCWLQSPDSWQGRMFLYLTIHTKEISHRDLEFVSTLLELRSDRYSQGGNWVMIFMGLLKCNEKKIINPNLLEKALTQISKTMATINNGNALTSLYWYCSYLGLNTVTEVIEECLLNQYKVIESFYDCFHEKFEWPNFTAIDAKSKYEKLSFAVKQNKGISRLLQGKNLDSIIFSILYARCKDDLEVESILLRYAIKISSYPNLYQRVSELCGFSVPERIRNIDIPERGEWMMHHLNRCYTLNSGVLSDELVQNVKETYIFFPFNISVLTALVGINSQGLDQETGEMLTLSINRTFTEMPLRILLEKAIELKNVLVLKLVLKQICFKKFHRSAVFVFQKYSTYIQERNYEGLNMLLQIIEYYELNGSELKVNESVHRIIRKTVQKHETNLKELYSAKEKASLKEEEQALQLLENGHYRTLLLLKEEEIQSTIVAEAVLQAAIRMKNIDVIIESYHRLGRIDPIRASTHNSEVELYFRIKNRRASEKKNYTGRIVSGIWCLPALLENPVNTQARKNVKIRNSA